MSRLKLLAEEEFAFLSNNRTLPTVPCPRFHASEEEIEKNWLFGKIFQLRNISEEAVKKTYPELASGGLWLPAKCKFRDKVAIIVPFRDRQEHLVKLIQILVPLLQKQKLNFRFIFAEQGGRELFNKGRLMNAGFALAEELGTDCVFFHDVDLLPESALLPYSCPLLVRHSAALVSSLDYKLKYKQLVGGVLGFRMEDFKAVNGYSNGFWGWGGEDDDMATRLRLHGLKLERPNPQFSFYTMLNHRKREASPLNSKMYANLQPLEKICLL